MLWIFILLLFICILISQTSGSREKLTFEEFCFPTKYVILPHQRKISDWFWKKRINSLLVYHKIGAGKTCVGIQIASKFPDSPCFLMPASLIPNFRDETQTPCGAKLTQNYTVYSYNKFLTDHENIPAASVLIIDEFQNIINMGGAFFKSVMTYIDKYPEMPVVIMSATPIFDNVNELKSLLMLLRLDWDIRNLEKLESVLQDHVSFYAGAPDYTYPRAKFHVVDCEMTKSQHAIYKLAAKHDFGDKKNNDDNGFYINTRQKSNIITPKYFFANNTTPAQILKNLPQYSCKFSALLNNLNQQLTFIYSGFTNKYGIETITRLLEARGYVNFTSGPGPRRYAVWSGAENLHEKNTIKQVFNSRENDDASQLQIVIGSPAIKEGVTLRRVRRVHIMEMYWNYSRLQQIYGRALRFCSHKDVPEHERVVDIYYYHAVAPIAKNIENPFYSVDKYMQHLCDKKWKLNEPYLALLQKCAVDKTWY